MATYVVKPGDNLTKIARKFGIASWRDLYNDPQNAAFKRKRPNPNIIFPGDTLYVPDTGKGVRVINMDETTITVDLAGLDADKSTRDLTPEEKRKLVDEVLEDLSPEYKQAVQKFLGLGGMALTVGQIADLAGQFSMGPGAIASPLLMAIRLVLAWGSAWEINDRMYGYRACAYTTTAWAFNDLRPIESPEMMRRFKANNFPEKLKTKTAAWEKASLATWSGLEQRYRAQGIEKSVLQAAYQIIGFKNTVPHGNPRQKLCFAMLKAFESKFQGHGDVGELGSWRDGYSVLYPR